jgi:hypothetical protein
MGVLGSLALLAMVAAPPLPLTIPFELENNSIFVLAGVNGSPPRWFILDTGASVSVLDEAFASLLRLDEAGEKPLAATVGRAKSHGAFTHGVTYDLAGLKIRADRVYVIDLSVLPSMLGRELAGIMGYDFFSRFVVDVDFDAEVITLWDPATYKRSGPGEAVKFQLFGRRPHVPVQIALPGKVGVERDLLVDTGSPDALNADILAQSSEKLQVLGTSDAGMDVPTIIGRADWAELAKFRFKGPMGISSGVPLVGIEVLRRFHVTFDYSRQTMWLQPNRHFDEPFLLDASGLDLRFTRDLKAFEITEVAQKSAAADAGIKAGDVLLEVNGRPAFELGLQRLNTLLTRAGSTYRLTIRRGKKIQDVTLTLRERL